jgi:hypothetical protein
MIKQFDARARTIVFFSFCIMLRLFIANVAYLATQPQSKHPIWKSFALVPLAIGIGLAYLYFTNTRLNAPEGGGTTWWAKYRLIHAMLYITAAIYILQGNDKAWVPLVIDVLIGIVLKLMHT